MRFRIIVLLGFSFILFSCEVSIQTGLDQLKKTDFQILQGKKIGLVVNHTSVDENGTHIIQLLAKQKKIKLTAIFAPEHGFEGTFSAGETVLDDIDSQSGIKIVSLYGSKKYPTKAELANIDILVCDIQDIGSRYYTYVSTIANVMDAAALNNIPVVILDRPNPLGRKVEGPILDKAFSSFVGMFPIPIRHGMTIGELATMINDSNWLSSGEKVDLTIVDINGWSGDIGYFSIPPSPNIADFNTALIYNGMCLLEGTNISEARGTNLPFIQFGTPWIDGDELTNELNTSGLMGVIFHSIEFTPASLIDRAKWPKYENKKCYGSRIEVTDIKLFNPLMTAVKIIELIYERYPDKLKFMETFFIDKLYGSDQLRKVIIGKRPTVQLLRKWQIDSKRFLQKREPYLRY